MTLPGLCPPAFPALSFLTLPSLLRMVLPI